jgi:hypothetical protein
MAEAAGKDGGPIANPLRSSLAQSQPDTGETTPVSAPPASCVTRLLHGASGRELDNGSATLTLTQLVDPSLVVSLGLSWDPSVKGTACGLLIIALNGVWLLVGCMALSVAIRVTVDLRGDEQWKPGSLGGPGDPVAAAQASFEPEPPGTALMRFYFIIVLFFLPTVLRLHVMRSFGPRRPYRDIAALADVDGGEPASQLVRDVRASVQQRGLGFYAPVLFGVLLTLGPIKHELQQLAEGRRADTAWNSTAAASAANGTSNELAAAPLPASEPPVVMPVLIISCLWIVIVCPLTAVAVQLQLVAHLHLGQLRAFVDGIVTQRVPDAASALKQFREFRNELDASSAYWQYIWLLLLGTSALGLLTVFGSLETIKRNAEAAEAEKEAGVDVALDRQFSASVDQLAVGGLPANLFCVVLLFCLISVARVNGAIAALPAQLCEVSAFGDSSKGTEQRHILINELQWMGAGWHIVGWHVSDGKLAAVAFSVVVPIFLSLRDSLIEVNGGTMMPR